MFKNKEYILAIVREGGFSKAAEKLYISQPSLSASVKRIEEKISLPIFDRTTTPIGLTEAGKEYVAHALEMERMEEDFERYISDCINLSVGEVKIGGSSLFSSFMLPKMISEFNKSYPRVNVKIFENNTKDLMHELAAGNIDIVLDNAIIKNDNITSTLYTKEAILLSVPKSFNISDGLKRLSLNEKDIKKDKHLSSEYAVDLKNFIEFPFILLNTENDTGKRAAALFKKHSLTPEVRFRLDQQMTAYNISASGLGIAFVSDTLVKNIDSTSSVYYYRLKDSETNRNVYLYQRTNRYHSIACQKFMEFCLNKKP